MHKIFGLALIATLAGCTSTRPVPIAAGFTEIESAPSIKVGHLYFTEGIEYAFTTASGTKFYELCYDDFALDNELKVIAEHVEEVGVDVTRHSSSPKIGASGETSLPFLPSIRVGSGRTYVVENLRRFRLTGKGMDIVRNNLGDQCRKEIVRLQAQNHKIVIVTAAQRADSVTDTITYSLGATVDTPIGSIGPSAEENATTEYKLVYLSALMQAPPQ